MWHLTDRFEPVRVGGTFVHRLRDAPATARRPPPRPAAASGPPRHQPIAPPTASARARPTTVARDVVTAVGTVATAEAHAHHGLEAFAAGDHATAVQAFRRWAYLEPNNPVAHFHLGVAFEELGDATAGNRAYERSRTLLLGGAETAAVTAFGGYGIDDIVRLLDAKRRPPP